MLLAVDIGNTKIAMGLFKNGKLIKKFFIPTGAGTSAICNEVKRNLKSCNADKNPVKAAIISSVVPSASKIVVNALKRQLGIRPILIGEDIEVPIKNLYKNPKQVGTDRLVTAYACLKLYGCPAIITDFGTATTFDYLNKNGAYCGGLITPGVEVTLEAFSTRTALLPRIRLKSPKSLIGKDTVESMRSGMTYGLASMCDGIIAMLKKKSDGKTIVVATGGLASYFAPYCKQIGYIDKDLILKGLYHISKNFS